MFQKRVINSWRNRLVTISQFVLPLLFAVFACLIYTLAGDKEDALPMSLSMNNFEPVNQVAHYSSKVFPSADSTTVDSLVSIYSDIIKKSADTVVNVNDKESVINITVMNDYLIKAGEKDIDRYNKDFMVAGSFYSTSDQHGPFREKIGENVNATQEHNYRQPNQDRPMDNQDVFNQTIAVAMFNPSAFHTVGISLNLMTNTLLQYFTGVNTRSIQATNHPLPLSPMSKHRQEVDSAQASSIYFTIFILFSMAFLVSSFSVFLIKERNTKAKHVQFVSGVHAFNFWYSTFMWDIINYLLPCCFMFVIFAAFQVDALTTPKGAGWVQSFTIAYHYNRIS